MANIAAHHQPILAKVASHVEATHKQAGKVPVIVLHRLNKLYTQAGALFHESISQGDLDTFLFKVELGDRIIARSTDKETGLFVQLAALKPVTDIANTQLFVGQTLAAEFPTATGTTIKIWE